MSNLEDVFKNLENEFDVALPESGHEARFLEKLNKTNKVKSISSRKKLWKPLLGIAASILLILTLVLNKNQQDNTQELANVSPKMAEAQDFFTLTINEELSKLNNEKSPEVQGLIKDAMLQLQKLESHYNLLKQDLFESGDDSRVIYAMISNFQNRIDILQHTIEQIKQVKALKATSEPVANTVI